MDCSGFVKTVYRLNGIELNRDASQQAQMGTEVNVGATFENSRTGDLLFFGQKGTGDRPERVTHVGLYLGDRMFIHSSGRVRVSSFDPASPQFEESLLKRFVRSRRLIPEPQAPDARP
jgi:gamma-D-glutamyl-L-lysine dipeptidyl-peptidase